nr:cytochrome B-C1 complex subunit 6 [Ipomoea batatas]
MKCQSQSSGTRSQRSSRNKRVNPFWEEAIFHYLLPHRARPSTSYFCLSPFDMSDEEVVDQKKSYEESCKPKCVRQLKEYQACAKRAEADESGHKHCTGQYFDYWHCIDKCVAPKLFTKLK